MTQAERIREYYREHPAASYDEVAEVVGTTNSNVRANLAKDIKAGRCVRLEDKSYDYSPYFNHTQALTELVDWKNDTRREWVDMLTRAAEKETDSNVMRLLIKEANKLTDLTNTLFAQLETLDDRDLTDDELKVELQRSKQMVAISGQILQAGQLALDAEKFKDKVGEVNAPIALLEG